MSGDEQPYPSDPLELIDNFAPLREALRGIVAMFITDGFTEVQARELAVAIWVSNSKGDATKGEDEAGG